MIVTQGDRYVFILQTVIWVRIVRHPRRKVLDVNSCRPWLGCDASGASWPFRLHVPIANLV